MKIAILGGGGAMGGLFGGYLALFVWGGLFLRDHRVRALFSA